MIHLVEPADYLDQLVKDIKKAKKQIAIVSLNIACDDATQTLFDELYNASKRGVDVRLVSDTHVFLELADKVFGPIPLAHPSGDRTRKAFAKLKSVGANIVLVGRSDIRMPYRGRTHAKWSIVDDVIYAFGGINLYQYGLENADYMLRITDHGLATDLIDEQNKIAENRQNYRGFLKAYGFGEVHVDSGQKFESKIYARACELSSSCESFVYVSQYYPRGKLYKLLKKKKGQFYINRGDSAPTTASKIMVKSGDILTNLKNSYRGEKYLHAKYLLFTMPDGDKIALTGSHNFSYLGVAFGTVEVALETKQQEVISQLESFTNGLVNG